MYQYSIEDLKKIKHIGSQPWRTAFIDECGSFGFDFTTPGTSKYYIICAICVHNNKLDDLQQAVEKVRNNNFGTGEMKSSTIGNDYRRRSKIIADLLPLEFRVVVLIANKQEFLNATPLSTYKKTFIKNLHQRLYDVLYHVYPKLKIVEDQTGTSEFQVGFKEYVQKNRPQYNLFNEYDFDYTDSRNSILVQLADIIGGTISKCYTDPAAPNYREMLKGKIIRIENFPNNITPYFAISNPDNNKFNKDIFDLSIKCANDFITKNERNEDYEKRLQVAFLKYLLFQVYNVNAEKFVSSSHIISILSEYVNRSIKKDFLYRRIIAQLRDAGVIISSGALGYKIPTCNDDITTYINQTNSLVSPMLHRLEICRNLIMQQTDAKLDILENDAFVKYKKFFDE
jgi:hypothetical protein